MSNTTNLNSAFAAKIKARRGRGKEKTRASSLSRISIPCGPLGFDFILVFRSMKWKENEKAVGHTTISHVA